MSRGAVDWCWSSEEIGKWSQASLDDVGLPVSVLEASLDDVGVPVSVLEARMDGIGKAIIPPAAPGYPAEYFFPVPQLSEITPTQPSKILEDVKLHRIYYNRQRISITQILNSVLNATSKEGPFSFPSPSPLPPTPRPTSTTRPPFAGGNGPTGLPQPAARDDDPFLSDEVEWRVAIVPQETEFPFEGVQRLSAALTTFSVVPTPTEILNSTATTGVGPSLGPTAGVEVPNTEVGSNEGSGGGNAAGNSGNGGGGVGKWVGWVVGVVGVLVCVLLGLVWMRRRKTSGGGEEYRKEGKGDAEVKDPGAHILGPGVYAVDVANTTSSPSDGGPKRRSSLQYFLTTARTSIDRHLLSKKTSQASTLSLLPTVTPTPNLDPSPPSPSASSLSSSHTSPEDPGLRSPSHSSSLHHLPTTPNPSNLQPLPSPPFADDEDDPLVSSLYDNLSYATTLPKMDPKEALETVETTVQTALNTHLNSFAFAPTEPTPPSAAEHDHHHHHAHTTTAARRRGSSSTRRSRVSFRSFEATEVVIIPPPSPSPSLSSSSAENLQPPGILNSASREALGRGESMWADDEEEEEEEWRVKERRRVGGEGLALKQKQKKEGEGGGVGFEAFDSEEEEEELALLAPTQDFLPIALQRRFNDLDEAGPDVAKAAGGVVDLEETGLKILPGTPDDVEAFVVVVVVVDVEAFVDLFGRPHLGPGVRETVGLGPTGAAVVCPFIAPKPPSAGLVVVERLVVGLEDVVATVVAELVDLAVGAAVVVALPVVEEAPETPLEAQST
ncbi:hypothetical protein HDV05_005191 [Chytridiales sp. JEL 0842]|nr:hypothetical protein HDV05_005191 [Chytridiales sp. JEL 0842]